MNRKRRQTSTDRRTQKPSNVLKFVSQKLVSREDRAARIARITAIIDDPCRGEPVRFAKIA